MMVGLPLRSLPGGSVNTEGAYEWGPLETTQFNLGGFWVKYNFEGYEDKPGSESGGGGGFGGGDPVNMDAGVAGSAGGMGVAGNGPLPDKIVQFHLVGG